MGSTIYNIPYLLKLDNKVDLDRLAEAIDSTVEAHPYLKTRLFMDDNGNVLQKRNDGLSYKTPILNGMNRDTLVRPYMLFNEQLFRFESTEPVMAIICSWTFTTLLPMVHLWLL